MLMWGQPSSAVQSGVPGRSALAYCGFADFFGVADVARFLALAAAAGLAPLRSFRLFELQYD